MASQTVSYQVYVRIKPLDVSRVSDDLSGFSIDEAENSVVVSSSKKNYEEEAYTFTKVFLPSSSQQSIYDLVVHPRLEDVMNGQDALVFSYGTTNSGKSYTMQGTPSNPGIIPRVLRTLFGSIATAVDSNPLLVPYMSKDAMVLSEKKQREILNVKKKVLGRVVQGSVDVNATISGTSPEHMVFEDEVPKLSIPFDDCLVGVWVSFYEIYNEMINDLLTPGDSSTPLNVVKDAKDDSFYPEGLTVIPVHSWEEAFDIYRSGKKKLQVSSTLMNRQSSRSHCVFSIKLFFRPANDPSSFYDHTSFNICDLAGNERVSHLEGASCVSNVGKKETLKINSSLLALNKCFVTLRSNLGKTVSSGINAGSFRDSKLTMVFKKFLTGRGKLSMLANISQDPDMLPSTIHILKMTAVVVSTRVQACKPVDTAHRPLRRRFSQRFAVAASPLRPIPEDDACTPQPSAVRPDQIVDLKRALEEKNTSLAEAQRSVDSMRERIEYLEMELSSFYDREEQQQGSANEIIASLEKQIREHTARMRASHVREMKTLARLHDHQAQSAALFERLADAFDIDSESQPQTITEQVIAAHELNTRLAQEEIKELAEELECVRQEFAESVSEMASLKAELFQAKTELDLERETSASLRTVIEALQKRLEKASTDDVEQTDDQSGYEATFEGQYSGLPVRTHRSFKWLSDEESSPLPPRAAATSVRKKRTCRKKKNQVPKPAPELVPQRPLRRRLLPLAAGTDHLDANNSLLPLDQSVQELQPSPNTFFKATKNPKK